MIKRLIFDVDDTLITGIKFSIPVERSLKRLGLYSEENVKSLLAAISSYEDNFNNYNKRDYVDHLAKASNLKLDDSCIDVFFDELKTCVPPENTKLKKL